MSRSYRPDRSREDVEDRRSPPAPGTITAIRSQDRDPDRVSVFIDGDFAFGLGREVAASAGLAAGDDLDASQIQEVLAQETRQRALSSSLTYLAHRPRTEGEIRTRLQRDGHDEDTIDATLVRLRDWHYVDDSDFARRWVENREEHRPRGVRLLATELRQKGVAPDIISQTIEDAGIDEDAGALDLARKRARQLGDLEPDIRARRLAGHLARRGYSWDVIRRTLEHLDSEAEANRDD